MMGQKWFLKLVSLTAIIFYCISIVYGGSTPLSITDLTDIDLSGLTNAYGQTFGCFWDFIEDGEGESKGFRYLDEDVYSDGAETGADDMMVQINSEDALCNIEDEDLIVLTHDSTTTTVCFEDYQDPGPATVKTYWIGDDGSTYSDDTRTTLAKACSCIPPASGDWIIINGFSCTLSSHVQITGNLNISNGSLHIANAGELNISGGFAYIYPKSNITIASGGTIQG